LGLFVIPLFGSWRSGGLRFEASPGKKFIKTPSQQIMLGMLVYACHPSFEQEAKTLI
jgi:hypothetical protein